MSIATEITRLQNAKSSIKTAIEGKGVEVPSTTKLDGYGELISSIPSGGDDFWQQAVDAINAHTFQMEVIDPTVETHWKIGNTEFNITDGVGSDDSISVDGNIITQDTYNLSSSTFGTATIGIDNIKRIIQLPTIELSGTTRFKGMTNLTRIEPSLHIGGAINECFNGCSKLEYVKLTNIYGGGGNYNNAFSGCSALTEIDLTHIASSHPLTLASFFADCSSLVSVKIENWITSNTTSFPSLFNRCTNIRNIDILPIDTTSATYMGSMFNGCTALETLKLGEGFFKSTSVTSISINNSPNWTHDSMIESLYTNQLNRDTTNAKTVTLHATAKARLSDTEKANIAALGITIA